MKVLILVASIITFVLAQFKVQFIGNFMNNTKEKSKDFCKTRECLLDAEILFLAASQNSSTSPCDDFKEFALGEFILYRALNDRYLYKGLQGDVDELYKEKVRKVLNGKPKDDDSRPTKIIKRYFNKCINSKLIIKEGKPGIAELLDRLGGSPFLARRTSWDPRNFNLTKLFVEESIDAISIFLDVRMSRCSRFDDVSKEIICLKTDYSWIYTNSSRNDVTQILLEFTDAYLIDDIKKDLLKIKINKAVDEFLKFIRAKDSVKSFHGRSRDTKILKLSEVSTLTPNLNINWTQIINNQLLTHSHVSDDEEIQIENAKLLSDLSEIVSKSDNETLAETFTLGFLYLHQWIFNVYPFDIHRQEQRGTKKAYQRWETCTKEFQYSMRPALELMYSHQYHSKNIQTETKALVREVIKTSIEIVPNKSELNSSALADVMTKLSEIKISVGFTDKDLPPSKLDEYYDELNLTSYESFVELWHNILRHHQKVQREGGDSTGWRRKIDTFSQNIYIKYDASVNILYIPSEWILYPWFHPQRPKFFNTATLFIDVLEGITFGLVKYLRDTWKLNQIVLGLENSEEVAYRFYKKWISSHKDLQLGANYLTNEQLFWMAAARKFFVKYQPNIPKNLDPIGQLQNEYLHVLYKRQPGFQEAYGCKLTEKDRKEYLMYQQEYSNILSSKG